MRKDKILLSTLLFLVSFFEAHAQNLLKYETKVITISTNSLSSGSYLAVDKGRFSFQDKIYGLFGSNPISFEMDDTIPVHSNYSRGCLTPYSSIQKVIQLISNALNNSGYNLKSTIVSKNSTSGAQELESIILIFEKATSYREEELYKLLGELSTKIDTTSKNYIEKAKTEINKNVLSYLKGIPDEVLTKSFKEQLLKSLSIEIDEKLKTMKQEILFELKKP